jgi:integrase
MVIHFPFSMRRAALIIRYKDSDGTWKRAAAAYSANGRIKAGHALIQGRAKQVEEYQYQVRYYDKRAVKYVAAGTSGHKAETKRRQIEQQTTAIATALKAGIKVDLDPERRSLARSAAEYIKDAEGRRALEAAAQARNVTREFLALVNKTYVDEVAREDIFRFHAALRKRGCGDRTVANKHTRLTSWLRFSGADKSIFPPKPRYEQALPTIYSRDETSTLLGQAGSYMHLAISIALKCGLREQELMHVEFSDINWSEKTLRVQGKRQWGFTVKTHEQREVPLPDDLIEQLQNWQRRHPKQSLILATKNNRPNTKLLFTLKTLARNAKLNCGRCEGCHSHRKECQEFTLHKFRRTYITTLLRGGVLGGIDLRTVQAYAGHKDIASTMRYLRPASAREAQAKLSSIQW